MVTRVITYTYDPLHRLTGAEYSTGERYEYAYDAVGNRTAYTVTTPLAGTAVTTYTYDAANRLLFASSPQRLITYTWDARGNLIGDGTFTYAYNAAGKMVRAQSITATIAYTYTADGLRVAQAVAGTLTTYAWDWASSVPELLSQSTDSQSTAYLVGHETLGWWDGTTWAYILPDGLGSVRQAADGAGVVVRAREWTPYGEEVGGWWAGLGYTGEWQDGDVGLVYLRARWYAPGVGIFTAPDPFPGVLAEPGSLHLYQYVGNNPLRYTDPSGWIAQEQAEIAERILRDISATYLVLIEKDWGWKILPVSAPMPPLPGVDPSLSRTACWEWQPGCWTLIELRLVAFALGRMGGAMGGPQRFREEMGAVFIAKTASTCGRGCTVGSRIGLLDQRRPPEEDTLLEDLVINGWVNFDAWTIVHELGHLWDGRYGWRLSIGLERFTGGHTDVWEAYELFYSGRCDPPNFRLPGCNRAGYFYGGVPAKGSDINFNREEDFAESVAAYVFPNEAQREIQRYHKSELYRGLLYYENYRDTPRWQYINRLINRTINVP
jgi:RHS repeat-associated protein